MFMVLLCLYLAADFSPFFPFSLFSLCHHWKKIENNTLLSGLYATPDLF